MKSFIYAMLAVFHFAFMGVSCTSGNQQDNAHSHEHGEDTHTHDEAMGDHEHTGQEEFILEDTASVEGSGEPHDHDHADGADHTH